jgi:hypothetical protein
MLSRWLLILALRPELLQQLYPVATKARYESTPEADTHGGDRRSEQFQPDYGKVETYGNSSRYQIARLKRDHPDIAEALARGEYHSVRKPGPRAKLPQHLTVLSVGLAVAV